ncbi:MAG: PAS domain S-box protein [Phycisphaerales bacterium]|nr:PAS domain S-box protein [Phycisphaerales bacterium]
MANVDGAPMLTPADASSAVADLAKTKSAADVVAIVCRHYGVDPLLYRVDELRARADEWLVTNCPEDRDGYVARLPNDPAELDATYRFLFVGSTHFLSDDELVRVLPENVVNNIFTDRSDGLPVRVWVAGCGAGEEAYSIGMRLREHADAAGFRGEIKIFATDLHQASIDVAVHGYYDERSIGSLSKKYRKDYFVKHRGRWRVADSVRHQMVITRHNLLTEAPFTRLDLVVCRNVLPQFQPAARKLVITSLRFALLRGGWLVHGSDDLADDNLEDFRADPDNAAVLCKVTGDVSTGEAQLSASIAAATSRAPTSTHRSGNPFQSLLNIYDGMLNAYMPAGFLINHQQELVHVFGGASKYLTHSDGRSTLNIIELIRPSLRGIMAAAICSSPRDEETVIHDAAILEVDGDRQVMRISVKPIPDPKGNYDFKFICLRPATPEVENPVGADDLLATRTLSNLRERIFSLEAELAEANEHVKAMFAQSKANRGKLEATQNELNAALDELHLVRQESQAVSEELVTIDSEHRKKVAEFNRLAEDQDNLVEASGVAVLFVDRAHRIRNYTPAVDRVFEVDDRTIGRPIEEVPCKLNWAKPVEDIQSVLDTQEPIERELRDRDASLSFTLRITPYQSSSGNADGLVLALVDNTAAAVAEATLSDTVRRHQRLIDAVGHAIWVTSADGSQVEHVNPMYTRIWGRSPHELKHDPLSWLQHINASERELVRLTFARELPNAGIEMRYHLTGAGGEQRWIHHRVLPLIGDDNNVTCVANIARDLTGRKDADGRFATVVRTAPVATAFVSDDGQITLANRAFAEMTGHSIDALESSRFSGLFENADAHVHSFFTAPLDRRADDLDADERRVVRVRRKDGSLIPIELTACPLETADGRMTVVAMRDLSALQRLHSQVARAEARLQRATDELDEFTYIASHDLGEPLRKLSAFSKLLPEDFEGELPDKARSDLEYIVDGAVRMQRLIDGLIDFSRCGRDADLRGHVSIPACADEAINSLSTEIEAAGAKITRDDLPDVIGNADLVAQLYRNLIHNALTYCKPETKPIIHLSATYDSRGWVLGVRDNGGGFDPKYAKRVFAPFKRAPSSGEHSGAGMGLSICRKIVQRHGGEIWVETQRGQGSHFMFTLAVNKDGNS